MCQKLKFRGWGTETGLQPHIEDHYQKQREDLYEAASNRETLSALSLAFTSPRYENYDYLISVDLALTKKDGY